MMYGNDDSPYSSDEDEEFCCPLCIEEMDLSDRSFKPCPCGYQICQFCYNNIRENPELNGKCPACRRLYDDESVVYTPISSEEIKRHQIKQANREKEKKQKERERKDTHESSSINASSISNTSSTTARKHLSGVRVIQKNLVYVIGFNPNVPTDDLAQLLKGDEYFGQYGKIQKIVINKRTNANGVPGVGVYVTYSRKDEAAKCIAAVDGTIVDGKYLRAAYGTTKYCSYYLRNQSCPNPNCMFLHEPGEEADSYSRQDLSTYQNRQQQHSSTALGSFTTSSNVSASSQGFRTHQISSPSTSSANLFTNPYSHVTGVSHQSSHFNSHSSSPVVSQAKLSSSPAISSASLHSDFDHHSPALPATAAWASKPSPQVSHAKISLNNSSPHGTPVARPKISTPIQTESRTPSPAQTSLPEVQQINSVIRKSQSPETTAPASSEKLALSQSQASLSTELKGSSLKVVKITKTSVSEPAHLLASDSSATPVSTPVPVILPSPRKLIPDPVAELLDNTVKIFCKYFEKDTPARFNFHEEQIRDDENTGDNQNFTSLPPLFSFGRFNDNFDLGEETENEWAFSSSKFVNMMNPRKIQPQISFTVLENFQQISDAKYREGRLDATPPGLLNTSTTSTSSSNSQELLARLMKGSSAKDSIPLSTNNDGQGVY
ncbi:hypothetical protein NADFUDRAFT_46621 [Nadsonia fulvescens var. elongata DSM 6958]|uniref:RING-type domain-containing protein n=1 Tax=Nadsonia fulvescens var. elongata DSM 6958 TaxID=857566 RepID=A0A1E3PKX2_9ASCO|nr:hypothetical protein NADFUDRAFT_46621 [Nadsonia fulvescens var. elongata DSM 6958]